MNDTALFTDIPDNLDKEEILSDFLSGNYLALAISLTSFMIGGFTAGLLLSMDTITLPTCGCSGLFDFGMPLEMAIVRNCILLVLLSIMRSLLNKQASQMQIQKV